MTARPAALAPAPPAVDALRDWRLAAEPYYRASGNETALFHQAHALRLPLLLKGPSGCGKTRLVEHMAWALGLPLVTVACHEDMTASDLLGRWLIGPEGTVWQDGPLAMAVRHGALCYLDEIVEARPDALTVLHPLADTRRVLPLERSGELLQAHPDFQLVVSYNPLPGRELRPATRQRFVALAFDYPEAPAEAAIVAHEGGVPLALAETLVSIGRRTRTLPGSTGDGEWSGEGVSTRMLVRAAQLVAAGLPPRVACEMALVQALGDEPELAQALHELVDAHFG